MKAKEFKIWQATAGLNGRGAAERLGKSDDTITRYRREGVPNREAPLLRLAMGAILANVAPWYENAGAKK